MTSDNPLDPKALELLQSLESDSPGAMTELVRLFIVDAPTQLQRVVAGYQDRDTDQVRQAAHFLRSGALALGLTSLVDQAHALERLEASHYGQAEADALLSALRRGVRDAMVTLLSVVQEI